MTTYNYCRHVTNVVTSLSSSLLLILIMISISNDIDSGGVFAFTCTSHTSSRIMHQHQDNSHRLFVATELPDSLQDAAIRAAEATAQYVEMSGGGGGIDVPRCRIDFDTSIGDETFTILKSSTEFMQEYVTAVCYALIPGLQQQKQNELMIVAKAKAELKQLENNKDDDIENKEAREDELVEIIKRNGRDINAKWDGPIARIYFPDEGNAALARRDWLNNIENPRVPICCEFSSCGGVQRINNINNDQIIFFFCPKASESDYVEEIIQRYENNENENNNLKLIIFVNPNLVDMGVTGYGMAGRRLRERLIDQLQQIYYLRTLSWGALTRQWPNEYSVWQEDSNIIDGGYRLIKNLNYLPSNPEVEDIYDIENGIKDEKQSGGLLDQFGDFVNGMMRL